MAAYMGNVLVSVNVNVKKDGKAASAMNLFVQSHVKMVVNALLLMSVAVLLAGPEMPAMNLCAILHVEMVGVV